MKSIYLSGIVGYEITADNIRSQINEGSKEKLQVIVNSPGGFVVDAFEIFNIFQSYRGEVEFVINGMAASAMSYIIMSGDKISAFKNSIFMAHRAQGIAIGDADEIQRESDIARAMDNVLAEAYTKKMKKKKEEILSDMKNEIWFIGWEALTDAGIIDNVIDSPDEIEFPDEETKDSIIYVDAELAKCGEPEKKKKAELQIVSCKNRMSRDIDRLKSNSMKAASLLPKQDQTPIEKAVEDIKITEEKMELQDYLAANPKAQAEIDELLRQAEAKGRAENSNVQAKIAKILTLEGVTISPEAKAAIDGELKVEEYMESVILAQKNLRTEKPDISPFASLVAKVTPGEQSPEDVPKELNLDDFDKMIEASAEKNAKIGRLI